MSAGDCVDMSIAVRDGILYDWLPYLQLLLEQLLCYTLLAYMVTKQEKTKQNRQQKLWIEKNFMLMSFVLLFCYRHHIPDVRIFLVPKLHFEKESIVTLMLVNPVEKPTYIRMEALQDSDTATAKVGFG